MGVTGFISRKFVVPADALPQDHEIFAQPDMKSLRAQTEVFGAVLLAAHPQGFAPMNVNEPTCSSVRAVNNARAFADWAHAH